MNGIDAAIKDFIQVFRELGNNKTSPYDTSAEVTRVEDDTIWVHIPGGVDETPVKRTMDAKVGDSVQVRLSGGTAWLTGNATAPPTDDTVAKAARETAFIANDKAEKVIEETKELDQRTIEAANRLTTVEGNITGLEDRVGTAENDITIVEGDITTLQGRVSTAEGDIDSLQNRIGTAEEDITDIEGNITILQGRVTDAEEDIDDTLAGLALAQDIVGTLAWITAHSTVTTDTTPISGKSYYIKNQDNTFTLVSDTIGKNPVAEGWYEMDEAMSNYVASHLALTNAGLYVMADNSEWKVLIASDGVYLVDNTTGLNKVAAKFKATTQLGYDNKARFMMSESSLEAYDDNNVKYFEVSANGLTYGSNTAASTNDVENIHIAQEDLSEALENCVPNSTFDDTVQNILERTAHNENNISDIDTRLSGYTPIGDFDNLNQYLDEYIGQNGRFAIINGRLVVRSENTSPYEIVITNEAIIFQYNGQEVASLTNTTLHITNSIVENEQRMGNFRFVPREGRLTLMKV